MSPIESETINLMLLQLAAKAHEICIVSSLSIIVLQLVRNELLFGDGLPLGLIGSGLTFNNLAFFFTREFFGSVKYIGRHGHKFQKIMFITALVVAGLTAALAGPASAVLIVPKSQDWKAGGTQLYLNGSAIDFWPESLSGDLSELRQFCNGSQSTRKGICPAGGFQSLWDHWGSVNSTNFRAQTLRSYAKRLSGSDFYWPVSSPSAQIPSVYALGNAKDGKDGATSLVQPHAASVVILQQLATDWWEAWKSQTGMPSDQVDDRVVSATFRNAISVVKCASPQKLQGSNKKVNFPSFNSRFNFGENIPLVVDRLNHTAANHLRFQWVHLPAKFGAASIGGVFEAPWEYNKTSRAVIACTVQLGWVPATVFIDKYTFWTGWYPWNTQYGERTPQWSPTDQKSTNGRISLGDTWLSLLTPPATGPLNNSWRPSTIESIFMNAGLNSSSDGTTTDWLGLESRIQDKVALIEAIVCSVVVDGLSRTGSYRSFNTSGSESHWSLANYNHQSQFATQLLSNKPALQVPAIDPEHLTKIKVSMKISGFSLQRSLAVYLAMSVLLTHLLMATAHIIYVVRYRRTSKSWRSIAEIIALSQNSPPAFDILANTGGGIKNCKTFLQMAKIRVRSTADLPNHEHIELVFEDSSFPDHKQNSSWREQVELRNQNWAYQPVTSSFNMIQPPAGMDAETGSITASTRMLILQSSIDERDPKDIVQPDRRYV